MKEVLELDTFLLIRLQIMSEDQLTEFFNKYNIKYQGQTWGEVKNEDEILSV